MDSIKESGDSPKRLLQEVILHTKVSSAVPTPLRRRRKRAYFSVKGRKSQVRLSSRLQLLETNEMQLSRNYSTADENDYTVIVAANKSFLCQNKKLSVSPDKYSLYGKEPTNDFRGSKRLCIQSHIPNKEDCRKGEFDALLEGSEMKHLGYSYNKSYDSSDESCILIHRDALVTEFDNTIDQSFWTPVKPASSSPISSLKALTPSNANANSMLEPFNRNGNISYPETPTADANALPSKCQFEVRHVDAEYAAHHSSFPSTRSCNGNNFVDNRSNLNTSNSLPNGSRSYIDHEVSPKDSITKISHHDSSAVIDPLIKDRKKHIAKRKRHTLKLKKDFKKTFEHFLALTYASDIFRNSSKHHFHPGNVNAGHKITTMFFKFICRNLNNIVKVNDSSNIDHTDIVAMLYETEIFPKAHSLNNLVKHYLPLEYQEILIPASSSINNNK